MPEIKIPDSFLRSSIDIIDEELIDIKVAVENLTRNAKAMRRMLKERQELALHEKQNEQKEVN